MSEKNPHQDLCKSESVGTIAEGKMANEALMKILKSKDEETEELRRFLKLEFSDENMDFWQDVENFKRLEEEFIKAANNIYKTYIKILSPREINIDSRIKEEIAQNMEHPHGSMFQNAQEEVFHLIRRGPYLRFAASFKTTKES